MSDTSAVSLYMANAGADVEFVRMIVEQEERTGNMPIDSLIILSRLRDERRLTTAELIPSIQKPETQVRSVLGRLTETGLIEAHGQGRGRSYTLSSRVYKELGEQIKYVRQTGADAIQQEQMIISFVRLNGSIRRADVMDLCKLDKDRASRLLKNMKKNNLLELHGRGGNAHYTAK